MQRTGMILGIAVVLALSWWATRSPPEAESPPEVPDLGATTHGPHLIGREATSAREGPLDSTAEDAPAEPEPLKPRKRMVVESDDGDEEVEEERWPLRPERTITGRVWGADGRPAEGVQVTAMPEAHPLGTWRKSVTRGDGTFRLPRLDKDRDYRVRTEFSPVGGRRDRLRVYSRVVRAGAEDVELRLVQPAYIRGRILDKDGKPLGNIAISAMPIENDPVLEGKTLMRSDPKGRFTLGPLPPGEYRMFGWSSDPRTGRTDEVLVVAPASDIVLQFGQSLTRTGTLIGADAAHFRFAWIATKPDGTQTHAHGHVAEDGTFEIGPMKELPGSAYFYHRESNRCALVEALRPGTQHITVTLHEGLSISGRIPSGAGGIVYVTSSAFGFQRHPRVEKDGRFRVVGLPSGSYMLRYFAPGETKLGPPISADAGEEDVLLHKRR